MFVFCCGSGVSVWARRSGEGVPVLVGGGEGGVPVQMGEGEGGVGFGGEGCGGGLLVHFIVQDVHDRNAFLQGHLRLHWPVQLQHLGVVR